jgi:hypothetical protein
MFPTSCQSRAIKTLQNVERAEYVVKCKVTHIRCVELYTSSRGLDMRNEIKVSWKASASDNHRRGRQLLASVQPDARWWIDICYL